VGEAAGTAFGDYIAGSNHILPTSGTARFASGVSPLQFRRTMARVMISDPDALAPLGAAIARAEGFELHARSMEARIRQNRRDE
jgi:histidinol dehydrogenase